MKNLKTTNIMKNLKTTNIMKNLKTTNIMKNFILLFCVIGLFCQCQKKTSFPESQEFQFICVVQKCWPQAEGVDTVIIKSTIQPFVRIDEGVSVMKYLPLNTSLYKYESGICSVTIIEKI